METITGASPRRASSPPSSSLASSTSLVRATRTSKIGRVCTRSAECPGDRCLDGHCTPTCRDAGECVAGWSCSPATDGVDVCQCAPQPEICDGRDNDCNGVVDDNCAGTPTPGQGSCTVGLVECGPGNCRNVQDDPYNCGACNHVCGRPCVNGQCKCAPGTTECPGGGCYDLENDNENCGRCGVSCTGKPGGERQCRNGACLCRDPRELLCPDGRCIFQPFLACLNNDCTSKCRPDQACFSGSCVDRPDGG